MSSNLQMLIVISGTFVSIATLIMIFGSYLLRRERIRGRLAVDTLAASDLPGGAPLKIINRIDDKLVGLGSEEKTKLRFELLRAGYFSLDAPKIFTLIRALLTIGLPLGWYISSLAVTDGSLPLRLLLTGILAFLGYAGPEAYVKHRQAHMLEAYRVAFPDFLDLLLVCVDAGLSFDAALVRVGAEFTYQSPKFATNLALLNSEIRSGRSTATALDNLSDRLGLDEAKAFSTLLKQSLELGSDIGDALRTYADEMRDKRLVRAETRANVLPVKMVFPLGVFIFPVMLIVTITPAFLRLARVFRTILGG